MSIPGAASPLFLSAAAAADAAHQIDRSLRFNQGDSPSLSKSFGSAGNRKKWTWSGWFKIGSESQPGRFFGAGADATSRTNIFYYPRTNNLGIGFFSHVGGSIVGQAGTTAVLADHSAWYHLVFAFDAANSTTADRLKIYINGTEQSISYSVNVSNIDHHVNNSTAHYVGRGADGYSFDGYLAEVHFVDGQALAPTDFGQTNSDNNWDPKAYSGSYGTNGFYLKFADNSSNSALGTDSSGNSNTWTVNNLSVAGSAWDQTQTWTSYVTGPASPSFGIANLFNGDGTGLSFSDGTAATVGNTLTFQPSTAITGVNTLVLGTYGNIAFTVNGTSVSAPASLGLEVSINKSTYFSNGVLSNISWSYNDGSNYMYLTYIKVNGILLVNPGIVDPLSVNIDSLIDTPTNYTAASGNNGGNYALLNPLISPASSHLSDGNLKIAATTTSWVQATSTIGVNSGKWYWEVLFEGTNTLIGVTSNPNSGSYIGQVTGSYGRDAGGGYYINGSNGTGYTSFASGTTLGVALDMDNGTVTLYFNGSAESTFATGLDTSKTFYAGVSVYGSTSKNTINFGQRPFAYTPPTGYVSLCTTNLPDPTIADGSTAFNATLYTGNGSARNISTPYGPDFVWIKSRSASYDHGAFDVLRGANQRLNINSNGAEGTEANSVTAFNSDSFSLGSLAFYNNPSTTFVAWNWNAGTSTVSNTDGSITSSVRANASAGFSIVSFTGDGSGTDTIGHGLNATPSTIWLKDLDNNNNWLVYTTEIDGSLDYLSFNQQSAKSDSSFTAPTSSVFSYGTDAADYIAYCFAPVAGYSEFGRYAGNQSTNGPFIYTGFRPRFVMVKVYDASDNWVMWDSSRGDVNVNALPLYPNLGNSEATDLNRAIDFLSNGFKLRGIDNSVNGTLNYVYWAFAEHPFKTARAR